MALLIEQFDQPRAKETFKQLQQKLRY